MPAVQVSHHPPICAAHAENVHFKYDLVSAPTTKFLGNSLEVYPYGKRGVWHGWLEVAEGQARRTTQDGAGHKTVAC